MSKKRLEIFHYTTFGQMEKDKQQRAAARPQEERFERAHLPMDLAAAFDETGVRYIL